MKYCWTWKRRQIEKYAPLTTIIIIISSSSFSIQDLCKDLLNCSYYGVYERCKSTIVLTSLLSKVGSGDDSVSEQIPNIEFIDILLRFHSDVWNVADMADIWSVKIFGRFEYRICTQGPHKSPPKYAIKKQKQIASAFNNEEYVLYQ